MVNLPGTAVGVDEGIIRSSLGRHPSLPQIKRSRSFTSLRIFNFGRFSGRWKEKPKVKEMCQSVPTTLEKRTDDIRTDVATTSTLNNEQTNEQLEDGGKHKRSLSDIKRNVCQTDLLKARDVPDSAYFSSTSSTGESTPQSRDEPSPDYQPRDRDPKCTPSKRNVHFFNQSQRLEHQPYCCQCFHHNHPRVQANTQHSLCVPCIWPYQVPHSSVDPQIYYMGNHAGMCHHAVQMRDFLHTPRPFQKSPFLRAWRSVVPPTRQMSFISQQQIARQPRLSCASPLTHIIPPQSVVACECWTSDSSDSDSRCSKRYTAKRTDISQAQNHTTPCNNITGQYGIKRADRGAHRLKSKSFSAYDQKTREVTSDLFKRDSSFLKHGAIYAECSVGKCDDQSPKSMIKSKKGLKVLRNQKITPVFENKHSKVDRSAVVPTAPPLPLSLPPSLPPIPDFFTRKATVESPAKPESPKRVYFEKNQVSKNNSANSDSPSKSTRAVTISAEELGNIRRSLRKTDKWDGISVNGDLGNPSDSYKGHNSSKELSQCLSAYCDVESISKEDRFRRNQYGDVVTVIADVHHEYVSSLAQRKSIPRKELVIRHPDYVSGKTLSRFMIEGSEDFTKNDIDINNNSVIDSNKIRPGIFLKSDETRDTMRDDVIQFTKYSPYNGDNKDKLSNEIGNSACNKDKHRFEDDIATKNNRSLSDIVALTNLSNSIYKQVSRDSLPSANLGRLLDPDVVAERLSSQEDRQKILSKLKQRLNGFYEDVPWLDQSHEAEVAPSSKPDRLSVRKLVALYRSPSDKRTDDGFEPQPMSDSTDRQSPSDDPGSFHGRLKSINYEASSGKTLHIAVETVSARYRSSLTNISDEKLSENKMADDLSDELDINTIPGVVPIPKSCPPWKRTMIEKKNQEKIDEYKVVWEKEREKRKLEAEKRRAAEEKRRLEEEKWAKLPEWKRKILQEKSRKEDEVRVNQDAVSTAPSPKQPPSPATKPSRPEGNQPSGPPMSGPRTKVAVLPPGPPVVPKKAPIPAPKQEPSRPEPRPVAAVAVFQNDEIISNPSPPILVSKITPTPLKLCSLVGRNTPAKQTIRVITKSSG